MISASGDTFWVSKADAADVAKLLRELATPAGFEPATHSLEGCRGCLNSFANSAACCSPVATAIRELSYDPDLCGSNHSSLLTWPTAVPL
jgi:hypothetical protein